MDIAVIGAGIGGLTAASFLANAGHPVTLFDQFDAAGPVGSGLVIQPVGQEVLAALGILPEALTKGADLVRMSGRDVVSNRTVLDVVYAHTPAQSVGLAIHRATLFELLMACAQNAGVALVPAHRATAVEGGSITFDNGTTRGTFDLIIDASGANSRLSPLKSRPLPYGAIWGTVAWPDTALPKNELRQAYRRASNMVGVMPAGQLPNDTTERATIFWSLPTSGIEAWRAGALSDWHAEVAALWPEAMPFFEQITDHNQMTFARYTHGTLHTLSLDRLVFIGDAAHRASPQLGQGANMALLDAWALSRALSENPGNVDKALKRYARARRRHTRVYQLLSAAFTPQYQSDSTLLPLFRDRILFPASQIPPVPRLLTALVRGTFLQPIRGLRQDTD